MSDTDLPQTDTNDGSNPTETADLFAALDEPDDAEDAEDADAEETVTNRDDAAPLTPPSPWGRGLGG